MPQIDIQAVTLKSATASGAPGPLGEHWTHRLITAVVRLAFSWQSITMP